VRPNPAGRSHLIHLPGGVRIQRLGNDLRSPQMKHFDVSERRTRLARRHHLAAPVASVVEAASDLIGLHSSDPTSVYLAARARCDGFVREDLEAALYETRSLVRMLGMRRTMFVVPLDVAAIMHAGCAKTLAPAERRRLVKMIENQGVAPDGEAWLSDVQRRLVDALERRGTATATELSQDVPELKLKLRFGQDKNWGGTVGVSTRVLFLAATDGSVIRGRPRGTWLSSQYRWALTPDWIPGGLTPLTETEAATELTRRWLRAFGPGTFEDLKWWTGWTVGKTRAALGAAGALEVDLGSATGFVLENDVRPEADTEPWVALLPSLDPTVMGWKERDWYLGEHRARLFDRNGNAGPTVWADGRVVGGWSQRHDGEIVYRIFEDIGRDQTLRIVEQTGELSRWFGDYRVTPRFRTPLEKELTS
jgi:hypothetical protein